jgi:hypothetical protein
MMGACKPKSVQALIPEIIGKWQLVEVKGFKNVYSTIPEWVPEKGQILEFKSNGEVFKNGELKNTCCDPNFYNIKGDSLTLINIGREKLDCSTVKCASGGTWKILTLTDDSLKLMAIYPLSSIKSDDGHEKYVRVK